MKARLVKGYDSKVKLLCRDGSFSNSSLPLLAYLLINFKEIDTFTGVDGNWRETVSDMAFYPGDTLAIVTDDSQLIVYDSGVFRECLESNLVIRSFVTSEEYAKIHNKTPEIIKVYCRNGRIKGAQKVGRAWMIPKDAPYPVPVERRKPKSCGPRPGSKAKK